MPRKKKGKKQTPQLVTAATPFIAKCVGCSIIKKLQVCEICEFAKCMICIEKHRETNELSQHNAVLEPQKDLLHQDKDLKHETLDNGLKATSASLHLQVTDNDSVNKTNAEYNTPEQILAKSKTQQEDTDALVNQASIPTRQHTTAVNTKRKLKKDNQVHRIVENFVLIWLDSNIDETNEDCRNSFVQLQRIVSSIKIFNNVDECNCFITKIKQEKFFMIVSGAFGQEVVPQLHENLQLDSIYVFCESIPKHELWIKKWRKLRGVFTQIESLCNALRQDILQCNNDINSISILSSTDCSNSTSNELNQSFMYSQLLKEILLEIDDDVQAKSELVKFFREQYVGNDYQLKVIAEFERDYSRPSPIWWYTRECFTYSMLNKALRTQDVEIIIKMGFFMRDIHRQIEGVHSLLTNQQPLTVYRGQGMLNIEFKKLRKNKDGLLSFNNFLSTSSNREISLNFARKSRNNPDLTAVLFRMEIDSSNGSIPFAALDSISYYKEREKEVLFSMHTIFRIGEIKQIEDRLWQVELKLTNDDDPELKALTEYFRLEIGGEKGWNRLAQLLDKMGKLDKAEEIWKILLNMTSNDDWQRLAALNTHLGLINQRKGNLSNALEFFKKALVMVENFYPHNHRDVATAYSNMGLIYQAMQDAVNALRFHEEAVRICESSCHSDDLLLANAYNNLGGTYDLMRNYARALSFYQKTLKIEEKSLPPNHPSLSITYNNIGLAYKYMGNYPSALSFYQKTAEIREKCLPPNHPDLGMIYSNTGAVYQAMRDNHRALSFLEKTLPIFQASLPPNHPYLITTYNNLVQTHLALGDRKKAFLFSQKLLELQNNSPF